MVRRRTSPTEGIAAVAAWANGEATNAEIRRAVRYTLEELATGAPGNSVEVRIPPIGVIQVIAGPRHTRGTPPNTIEMAPQVWLELATGRLAWSEAVATGQVAVSGTRADLAEHLPVLNIPGGSGGEDGITFEE